MAPAAPLRTPPEPGGVPAPDANFTFAAALVDALARAGLEHVCVCPGSRSAPLAAAVARAPGLAASVHIDERCAGFFALGLARARRRPVAVVCSSGTAAANLLPAAAEAHHARVPLLLLTADRPPEVRDFGAAQTIRQSGLFRGHVRFEADVATPDALAIGAGYARALGARAVAEAVGPPAGPVHLNLPFREPLHPARAASLVPPPDPVAGRGARRQVRGARRLPPDEVEELASFVAEGPGAVIAGPLDADLPLARAVAALARASGWPVLAEATSGLRTDTARSGLHPAAHPEALARVALARPELRPERVLLVGPVPTGRALQALPGLAAAGFVLVDGEDRVADPGHRAWRVLAADPEPLLSDVAARLAGAGAPHRRARARGQRVLAATGAAEEAVARRLARPHRLHESGAVRILARALPDGAALLASNSLPVRFCDAWLPPRPGPLRVLANRGANGIDGIPSTALGAAAAGCHRPVVLLTGDVALAHDVGGLAALRRLPHLRLVAIVLDNGGGGIFDRLPIAGLGEAVAFERCFRTPPRLPLDAVAALAGMAYAEARDPGAFEELLSRALRRAGADPGASTLIRVPVDPAESLGVQQELEGVADAALAAALDGRGGGAP